MCSSGLLDRLKRGFSVLPSKTEVIITRIGKKSDRFFLIEKSKEKWIENRDYFCYTDSDLEDNW